MLSYPKNRNIHRPLHLYLPETSCYFISCRTYKGVHYFDSETRKEVLSKIIFDKAKIFKIFFFGWAVLNNHYHLLLKADNGTDLIKLISQVNGKSSYLFNKLENIRGRKIWFQYRDKIIRDKKDFYIHLNYIHQNPIKHGLVKNFDELANYKFCSYKDYLKELGRDWLDDCFENYPVINYINE